MLHKPGGWGCWDWRCAAVQFGLHTEIVGPRELVAAAVAPHRLSARNCGKVARESRGTVLSGAIACTLSCLALLTSSHIAAVC